MLHLFIFHLHYEKMPLMMRFDVCHVICRLMPALFYYPPARSPALIMPEFTYITILLPF